MVEEEGASRWHMLGFGTWPPFLPSMLQILEMIVGIAVCGSLPGITSPALALGSLLLARHILLVDLDSRDDMGPARS